MTTLYPSLYYDLASMLYLHVFGKLWNTFVQWSCKFLLSTFNSQSSGHAFCMISELKAFYISCELWNTDLVHTYTCKINKPHLPEEKGRPRCYVKATHCAGCYFANTRPHQLCWDDWEMRAAMAYAQKCSQVAGHIQKVSRSSLMHAHTNLWIKL